MFYKALWGLVTGLELGPKFKTACSFSVQDFPCNESTSPSKASLPPCPTFSTSGKHTLHSAIKHLSVTKSTF